MDINNFDRIKISGYTLIYVNNIIKCTYIQPNKIFVDTVTKQEDMTRVIPYLILDTPNHVAVGHWLYESAMYIPVYHLLKKMFEDIKIVLVSKRHYKDIILRHMGVSQDDIVYEMTSKRNVCFFPKIDICLFGSQEYLRKFEAMVNNYYETFNTFKYDKIDKVIDTIILPRHNVENYANNDRRVDTKDIEKIENIYVYDSSKTDVLEEQIINIKKSKNIIIPDGSAFVLNGTFANNSRIIILGFITIIQALTDNPKLKVIIKKIAKHNEIIYIVNNNVTDRLLQTYTYEMVSKVLKSVDGLIKVDTNIYIDNTYGGIYDENRMRTIQELWQK